MGNNVSTISDSASSKRSSSRFVLGHRASSLSIATLPSNQENIHAVSPSIQPVTSYKAEKRPLKPISIDATVLPAISEKRRGKLPEAFNHLDKLPDQNNMVHHKRIKSQRNSRQTKVSRDRYSSTISASGFSSTIGDPLHFSIVGDSTITDITNVSSFSVSSFLDKAGEDNHYIMAIPDSDFASAPSRTSLNTPSIEDVSTTEEILDLLTRNPESTYDILTGIYGSERMRTNSELQKEAFQAAETWSLRPTDVSAKIIVACCKLCGWGTSKNSKKGFNELQALANKGVWEAFYYLGQCYHYGVEQASEGYNLSGRPLSTHVIQPIDRDQATHWYLKVIDTPSVDVQTERLQFYIAEAQFRIAAINFSSGKIDLDNVEDNVSYLRHSVSAGNRKAEFSLGLLLETGVIEDTFDAKEYYTRSANKGYAPAQIQLALILLRENSPEGVSWLRSAARLGDPRAFYHLGESYEFGKGVKADPIIAAHNYQTAADRFNHRQSEFRLGMHYLHGGLSLDKDTSKAFVYLERAAKGGYAEAQYLLGIMYRDGRVPTTRSVRGSAENSRNKKEAFRWIRKAAAQNMHTAITQIANCYEEGVGTPVNHALATEYYEIATKIPGKHLASAQHSYARFLHKNGKYEKALEMYLFASGLERSPLNTCPPTAPIARTAKRMVALLYLDQKDTTTPYKPKEAFELLNALASSDEGDADAHYWIAVCYEEGVPNVVDIDLYKSFDHYMISANLGSSDSQFQVGHMLCKGIGVKEDRLAAFKWFQRSAEKNNAKALYYIGIYYYNGSGSIARDHEQARIYFKRSAELGHVESMVSYAQTCQEKLKNPSLTPTEIESLQAESFKWYTKSAKQNHTTALRELGRLYGAKGDLKTSAECYMKATSLNDALSALFLGGYYENGQGVTLNKQTALKYYVKAIELGQPTALFAIAELYEKLSNYEKAYSYYKRVSQDARISKNFKSSKISRLKMALYSLHYDPNTLISDSKPTNSSLFESIPSLLPKSEAFQVLLKLANQEHFHIAYNWIAECYQDGRGVSQNTNESVRWRIKASEEANDIQATLKLASMYENGTGGVQKDTTYSHQLYQICGEKNNVISQHKLGMAFWRGHDIPINLGMAVIWFTRAARQSYAPSHWALGQIALENGDLHIAIAWWETAIQLNPGATPKDPINLDHLLTTTGDSEALVILGKIISQQQKDWVSHLGGSMMDSSICDDEQESLSRAQQESRGLAVRCFGQAALMGNVEGMYLTAEAWHKDKDYPIALENYEKAAVKGHVPSRIMCAIYQIYGLGGKEADARAGYEELLECAQLDADAYLHLGRCSERGLGTIQDTSKALDWYQLSIEKTDSSEAMFRTGQIYSVEQAQKSVYWYQRAINKDDHPRANLRLAFLYMHGIYQHERCLLEPDISAAVRHFRAAAKQNDLDAMYELGQLLLATTKDELFALFPIELQLEGMRWYELAADKGSLDAQRELGNLYHRGRESFETDDEEEEDHYPIYAVQQDFEKAYDYFSFAAHLGDKASALFLGTYYEHGICVPPNLELAQSWYTMAVELGESIPLSDPTGWWPAQLCLARVLHQNQETQNEAYALFVTVYSHKPEQHMAYLEMILARYELYGLGGVPVQAEKAVVKLLNLAEEGYLKAFFPIAQCFEKGIGVKKDLSKALQWYVLLIHNPVIDQDTFDEEDLEEISHAYFCLAEFYRQGIVVAVDLEKSDMLYRIAAERGSKHAKQFLASNNHGDEEADSIDSDDCTRNK